MATTQYFSGAGDGSVRNFGYSNYATIRNASSGDLAYPSVSPSSVNFGVTSSNGSSSGTGIGVGRHFYPFNTDGGPAPADVTAISLFVKPSSIEDDAPTEGDSFMHVVDNTSASSTTLVTSDYSKIGGTSWGSAHLGDMVVDTYEEFVIDATGRGNYNNTSGYYTKYVLREGHDLANTWPTYSGAWPRSGIDTYMSEETGTSSDPYLEVTYTVAPTIKSFGGVAQANIKSVAGKTLN